MRNSRVLAAIIAIENERTQLLDNEKVIDAFAASHKNRRIRRK